MHGFGYSGVPWVLEPVLCTFLVMTIADLLCYRLLEVGVWQMDRRARDSGHTEPLQAGAQWLRLGRPEETGRKNVIL